jgi:hypothetical protein
MNSNLENPRQIELALTDWVRVAGILIFVGLICFSIVLFGNGSIPSAANQIRPSSPFTGLETRSEPTPEARVQSVTAVTAPESHSKSTTSSSQALSPLRPPIQQPLSPQATEGPAIVNVNRANPIRRPRANSVMRRPASRRRSAADEAILKSLNILVNMWRHAWKMRK